RSSVADECDSSVPPSAEVDLAHGVECEVRSRVGGVKKAGGMPAGTCEPCFEKRELGGSIMPVIADRLMAVGAEAQRSFGFCGDSPGSDRGNEASGSVVHLVPTVEFVERRGREPRRVQTERPDEPLF